MGVVSAPDRPAGRSGQLRAVPVATVARARGLVLLQPTRLRAPAAIAQVSSLLPDLGVLADYGQIVPAGLLDLTAHGMLNLHPSLLPRHRGASPIPATILAGDEQTGVSLIRMDAGLDSGPLIATEALPLAGTETAPELETRAATIAAGLLDRSLGPWLAGELVANPQPAVGISLTRPLRRADGELDPGRPLAELERQVRAYMGWPGSFIETPLGRLIVLRASVGPALGGEPGTIVAAGAGLALETAGGSLRLDEVQLAGGRPMTGAELRRGRPMIAGTRAER